MTLPGAFPVLLSKGHLRPVVRGGFVPLLLSVAMLVLLRSPAAAVLLVEDSFDYPAHESINQKSGGTGFLSGSTGVWNKSSPPYSDVVSDGGLDFQNLTASGNALLSYVAEGDDSHQSIRSMDPVLLSDGSTYWFSFLMRLDSIPEGSSISDFQGYVALMPASSGSAVRVGVLKGTPNISISSNTSPSQKFSTSEEIAIDQTYFVVLRIDVGTSVTMYLDPTPGLDSPLDLYEAASASLSTPTQFSRLGIFSSGEGAQWTFDELRLGTAYLDVAPIPEPSEGIFLALGAAMLLMMKGRRCFRGLRCVVRTVQ